MRRDWLLGMVLLAVGCAADTESQAPPPEDAAQVDAADASDHRVTWPDITMEDAAPPQDISQDMADLGPETTPPPPTEGVCYPPTAADHLYPPYPPCGRECKMVLGAGGC